MPLDRQGSPSKVWIPGTRRTGMSALKHVYSLWDMSFGTKTEKAFGFQNLGIVGILSGRL